MKSAIPREIVDAGGSFEEHDWLTSCRWRVTGDKFRDMCDLEIVEVADKPTFEALGEKIFHYFHLSVRGANVSEGRDEAICCSEVG